MFINESFLSFVWQFQYFNKDGLALPSGEPLTVIAPGHPNSDSGPDFSNARIRISDISWHGNVEIHVKSSNWLDHEHHENPAYDNVILHVVWENDSPIFRTDGTGIPALELKGRVDDELLGRYHNLVESRKEIACDPAIRRIEPIHLISMQDKVLAERFREKSDYVLDLLKTCGNDWEELSFRILCRNFGFKINQHPMTALATYLPFKMIRKHSGNLIQIEALLFGTAGLLKGAVADPYQQELKNEFSFLCRKYDLNNNFLARHQWKFMRTRPGNFPTLRIGQLASVLYKRQSIFSLITTVAGIRSIRKSLSAPASPYWQNHYDFGKKSKSKLGIGDESTSGLIINTFVPVLGAYGRYLDDQRYIDRGILLLQHIPPENNRITRIWENISPANNAAESQSMIQLFNGYCIKKKCLNCMVGTKLLQADDRVLDH